MTDLNKQVGEPPFMVKISEKVLWAKIEFLNREIEERDKEISELRRNVSDLLLFIQCNFLYGEVGDKEVLRLWDLDLEKYADIGTQSEKVVL